MRNNYHPFHYDDFKRSGLSDDTIKTADFRSLRPADINRALGINIKGVSSVYEIPYPDCNGFSRFRLFYGDGKAGRKYSQPKNSENHLYIPAKIKPKLDNASIPLYITEGEKKTLKACQEGLPCIGLSGLWNWSNGKKELIADFDQIAFAGRQIFIVPDNDYKQKNKHGYKKNLEQAVTQLAAALTERGARVFIVELPEGVAKGLDDYLCPYSVDDFKKLPIKEITMDKSNRKKETKEIKVTLEANLTNLVDVVLDKDVPAFLFNRDGKIALECEIIVSTAEKIQPPGLEHLPFPLVPSRDVLRHLDDKDDGLFDDVLAYLKSYAHLTEEQWLICTAYVFLTYLHDHQDIQYIPMLFFYAVPERGKTRTGKALTYVSFRGVHCVDLRETNLFRYAQELRATLFLDIMDMWKKAERNQSEDVLLLRYEKGATVARVLYPEKGAFRDTKYYKVFGPTIMASNEPIHKILDTRCITFQMPNKPGHYRNPTPQQGLPLRARLTAWRARHMATQMPEVHPIVGIGGRLWDICKPLIQICLMVAPERHDALIEAILNIATERTQERQSSDDGKLVQILIDLSPDDLMEWDIATKEITEKFNKDRPSGWEKTPHAIGRRLRALGVKTRIVGGDSRTFLNKEIIKTLGEQYGLLTPPEYHANHENIQEADIIDDLFHDIQHDFQYENSKSCSKSCPQVVDSIKDNDIHDIHDSNTGEEIIIDISNGCRNIEEVRK